MGLGWAGLGWAREREGERDTDRDRERKGEEVRDINVSRRCVRSSVTPFEGDDLSVVAFSGFGVLRLDFGFCFPSAAMRQTGDADIARSALRS